MTKQSRLTGAWLLSNHRLRRRLLVCLFLVGIGSDGGSTAHAQTTQATGARIDVKFSKWDCFYAPLNGGPQLHNVVVLNDNVGAYFVVDVNGYVKSQGQFSQIQYKSRSAAGVWTYPAGNRRSYIGRFTFDFAEDMRSFEGSYYQTDLQGNKSDSFQWSGTLLSSAISQPEPEDLTARIPISEQHPAALPATTPEAFTGMSVLMDPVFFEGLGINKKPVGRVTTAKPIKFKDNRLLFAGAGLGTGFLVGTNLLLTARHVVRSDDASADYVGSLRIDFNAEADIDGNALDLDTFWFADDPIVAEDESLDYALVKLEPKAMAGKQIFAGAAHGSLRLPTTPTDFRHSTIAHIIQHPNGLMKKVAFAGVTIPIKRGPDGSEPALVYYTTDTHEGSSGSPVFSYKWELLALHVRKGEPDPMRKDRVENNCGIRIDAIVTDLKIKLKATPDGAGIAEELGIAEAQR